MTARLYRQTGDTCELVAYLGDHRSATVRARRDLFGMNPDADQLPTRYFIDRWGMPEQTVDLPELEGIHETR